MVTAMLVAVAPIVSSAGQASAHTELISSNPSEGATLTRAPQEVVLTFSEPPILEGSAVVIKSESNASAPVLPLTLIGSEIHGQWPAAASSGAITITWRAVADDGHISTGSIHANISSTNAPSHSPTPMPTEIGTNSSSHIPWKALGLVLISGGILAFFLIKKSK